MRSTSTLHCLLALLAALLAVVPLADAAADEPGPFASADDKLDYLLSTWQGHSLEELQEVWGREDEARRRGGNKVYVFERRIKIRASLLSGISVYGDGLRCTASFEVDDTGVVVRAARRGGGKECWGAFRRNEPR